jgi:crotonobetainyl-CoA:carnitine CoA-transferase CaiB-like acyl-CoA transferase
MTHESHELARYSTPLTGELACYRIYECADGRYVTVAALEPKFWLRLCELLERPDLAARSHDAHEELEALFRTRTSDEWLGLLAREDTMVGPVASLAEAEAEFGSPPPSAQPPRPGEHTHAWRAAL